MVLPPLIAAKGAQNASKALTGDIYVRRWTSKGKGKKPPVEHEVRVNAVTGALAAVGIGLTALAGGVALWMMQVKLAPTAGKTLAYTLYGRDEPDGSGWTWTLYRGRVPIDRWKTADISGGLERIYSNHLPSKYHWTRDKYDYHTDTSDSYTTIWDITFTTTEGMSYPLASRKGLLE